MKLLERLALVCRRRGMARRTADAYALWTRHFLKFCAVARGGWTSPQRLGTDDVEAFLNHLVGERHLSTSSQNQALNALVFLYRHVLTTYGVGDFGIRRSGLRPEMRWMSRASI